MATRQPETTLATPKTVKHPALRLVPIDVFWPLSYCSGFKRRFGEYGRLAVMVPMPVRNAFGIARHATGFVTWTRGALITFTAAGLKFFFQPKPTISWDALYFTMIAAIVWYVLVFLRQLIFTVPTVLSGRISVLEEEKTRIEGDRDRLAAAVRTAHDEEARIAPLLVTIATLKGDAREIKRRWPNCTFVKFPTHRFAWSPFIGQPETGEQNQVTQMHRMA